MGTWHKFASQLFYIHNGIESHMHRYVPIKYITDITLVRISMFLYPLFGVGALFSRSFSPPHILSLTFILALSLSLMATQKYMYLYFILKCCINIWTALSTEGYAVYLYEMDEYVHFYIKYNISNDETKVRLCCSISLFLSRNQLDSKLNLLSL